MLHRLGALAVAVATLALVPPALAQDDVTFDPDSAAGKEYGLPFEQARRDASGGDGRSGAAGGAGGGIAGVPGSSLFGEGLSRIGAAAVGAPSSGGRTTGSARDRDARGRDERRDEPAGAAGRRSPDAAAGAPGTAARRAAQDAQDAEIAAVRRTRDVRSASVVPEATWTFGPAVVLLLAMGLSAVIVRRFGRSRQR